LALEDDGKLVDAFIEFVFVNGKDDIFREGVDALKFYQ